MSGYDCTETVKKHQEDIKRLISLVIVMLVDRGIKHDKSKLKEPEKSMFDLWTPKLKDTEYGSDAYREALAGMGEGLMHHYANNRHHPEHFQDGIDSMTLIDLVEMVCDWMVSAGANGRPVDVGYQAQRFNISDQLARVIENTIIELGSWQ